MKVGLRFVATYTKAVRAIEVLRKIAAEDVLRLPRLESPQSAAMMARMISSKNLDILRNDGLPLDQRMNAGNGFTTSTKAMLMLYAEPESKGIHFDREIVGIVNLLAQVAGQSTQLSSST